MKRENGRQYFYQWELNQRLTVPADCTEVHFENGTQENALPCKVFEEDGVRQVNVPNILLQTAAVLHCYAWNESSTSVMSHSVFSVVARQKPEDYVYEQTEVLSVERAVQEALRQAKESGQFDGPQGPKGDTGERGPQGVQGPQGTPGATVEEVIDALPFYNEDGSLSAPRLWINKQYTNRRVVQFISSGGNPIAVKNKLMYHATCTGLTLYLYGKNLFDASAHTWVKRYIGATSGQMSSADNSNFVCTEDYIRVTPLRLQYITLNHAPVEIETVDTTRIGLAFYGSGKNFLSGTNGNTVQVPSDAVYMRLTVPSKYASDNGGVIAVDNVQVELGSKITAYEPFKVNEYSVQFGGTYPCGGTFDWTTGVYTLRQGDPLKVPEILDRAGFNTIIIDPIDNKYGVTSSSIEIKHKVDIDVQVNELVKFHYNTGIESLIAKVIDLDTRYGIDNLIEKLEKLSGWI